MNPSTHDFFKKTCQRAGAVCVAVFCFSLLTGTLYIEHENGKEVRRWEEKDGSDRTTIIEDGQVTHSSLAGQSAPLQQAPAKKPEDLDPRVKKTYHRAGELRTEEQTLNKQRNGRYTLYYKNGRRKIVRHYKDDILNGWAIAWDPKGKIAAIGNYKAGDVHGPALAYNPYAQAVCAAFYWNGNYLLPLWNPSCTDPGGIMHAILDDRAVYDQ